MRLLSSTSLTLCWKTFRRDGAGAGTSWGLKIIFISELWNWTSYKWFLLSTYIKLHIIRWPPAIKRGLLENPPFVISWFSQLESFISMADFQASHVWLPARISNYFHTSYPIIYYPTVLLSHITLFLSHDCLLISHHPYQTTSIYIYIYYYHIELAPIYAPLYLSLNPIETGLAGLAGHGMEVTLERNDFREMPLRAWWPRSVRSAEIFTSGCWKPLWSYGCNML